MTTDIESKAIAFDIVSNDINELHRISHIVQRYLDDHPVSDELDERLATVFELVEALFLHT